MGSEPAQVLNQTGEHIAEGIMAQPADKKPVSLDPLKLQRYMERLRDEQNLIMGITGGLLGAAIGAVLWAVVTVLTEYQIGYMALGVGFLTGVGVKLLGRGVDRSFQMAGAVLALAGCLAGNLMVVVIFGSLETGLSVSTILAGLTAPIIIDLYAATFNVMDLLFYGLAITIGYRNSLWTIPREDMEKLV
jgi:hypothetical protein